MEIVNGRFVNIMIANWRFFCIIFAKKIKTGADLLGSAPVCDAVSSLCAFCLWGNQGVMINLPFARRAPSARISGSLSRDSQA